MALGVTQTGRVALTSLGLFCFSLFLTAYSSKNPGVAGIGYAVVAEVVRPVQSLTLTVRQSLAGVGERYITLVGVKEENVALHERLSALEAHNSRLLEFESENQRLRNLLQMKESAKLSGITATVIGYDPSSWVQAVVIDKGSRDGVAVGQAVVQGEGLVGKVTSVSLGSARVLLITDPLSGVDGILQGSRARGIVQGENSTSCSWHFVLREEELKVGDRVITSGVDGVYPKGLLVGIVSDVDSSSEGVFQTIRLKPSVDMSRLETVLVVNGQIASEPEVSKPAVSGLPKKE